MRNEGRSGVARSIVAALVLVALPLVVGGCSLLGTSTTPTPLPTNTVAAAPRQIPTWTPVPSPTPEPTAAPVVPVSDCRLGSTFGADVTIPDGTKMQPGQAFTKTWALQNTGSCAWDDGYYLVFAGKEQMGAPDRVPVPPTEPGDLAEISVEFTAPEEPGEYRSDWQMWVQDSEAGTRFGAVVWVTVKVE